MGEHCILLEALTKADFWLIFCSLLLGSGIGLTVIDDLGQMSQSLGYDNTHVFSMISIWNILGRVGGGYISENIVRYKCQLAFLNNICFQVLYILSHPNYRCFKTVTMHIPGLQPWPVLR